MGPSVPAAPSSKNGCTTSSYGVNLAVSSASFLVSPSCLSEYFTALALLLLSVLTALLSFSALFLAIHIFHSSVSFLLCFLVFRDLLLHKLLESPLYFHSVCFHHLLPLSSLDSCAKCHFVAVYS